MNQEMKNRLLRLKPEALVEVIDAICGQMGMDFHFGQDPCDCINNPIFYVYGGPNVGTFTVLNYDPMLHDKPKHILDMDKVDGCGCMNSPPCLGCAPKTYLPDYAKDLSDVPVDPDANRLNLYAVWTIGADTSETEKVYIMALHEEGAACLYHKSRARDHGNILCEVVVSKVADAEVCDE